MAVFVLWSAPRARSTAFFRSMAERGDLVVGHEPFSNLLNFGEGEVGGRRFGSAASLLAWLRSAATDPDDAVFLKETSDYRYTDVLADRAFLAGARHAFLLRRPEEVAASYHALYPGMSLGAVGLEHLHELHAAVADPRRPGPPAGPRGGGSRPRPTVPAMALFHRATITPTKPELLAEWVPTRPWGPPADGSAGPVEVVGAFRFDDPEGRVGLETHLVTAGGVLFQVPLTYRDEPLDGAEDALVTEMHHSALGPRWVYDGLRDPRFVVMLAGVTMTGQGEALGMVEYEGRWYVAPAPVRIRGGGWGPERVAVDAFELVTDDADAAVLRNDRFELTVARRPGPAPDPRPPVALTATWPDHPDPVLLATLGER